MIKIARQIDGKCEKTGASALLIGHGELKAVSRLLNSSGTTRESLTEKFMKINCNRLTDSHILLLEACESKLISSNSTIHRPKKFSTAWASLLVAIMGGYHALPSAKPFGQTTLWRGLFTLESAVLGYEVATIIGRSGRCP